MTILIGKGKDDFSHPLGLAGFRTVEDHVFHGFAPQLFGALFAESPADGIDDIGFSAPVRPHHRRDAGGKVDLDLIRERLEAEKLDFFNLHDNPLRKTKKCQCECQQK